MMIAILIPSSYLLLWEGKTKRLLDKYAISSNRSNRNFIIFRCILFYFFWEVMFLPVFLLIGLYGFGNKVFTTIKVTVYTMAGSLLMFVAILYLGLHIIMNLVFGHLLMIN